jgi:hypothetical protein
MASTIPKQLSFTFHEPPRSQRHDVAVVLEGEALPPVAHPSDVVVINESVAAEAYEPSAGQHENVYLLHRMSKFEDRANTAVNWSLLLSLSAVLAKGGIPLGSALLERMGLPEIGDGRLLTGLLTLVTLLFAGAAAYYVLQIRHHAEQMQIPAMRRTRAGDIAQAIFTVVSVSYLAIIVGVVCLCLSDVIYAFTTLRDHLLYTMTGWDAQVGPP